MSIKNRIMALEGLTHPTAKLGEGREALSAAIETVASRLCGGPLMDRTDASKIERVALALERGDVDFAQELLVQAKRRNTQ